MGLFSGGGFLGELGGLSGINKSKQEKAVDRAGAAQIQSAKEARELYEPIRTIGMGGLTSFSEGVNQLQVPDSDYLRAQAENSGRYLGLRGLSELLGTAGSQPMGLDPNVLQSPFFQALQEESTRNALQSASAAGRGGAGGTKDAVARQSLLLGNEFGQQDLNNRMAAQQQRFNLLQSGYGFGLGAQNQTFNQLKGLDQTRFANQLDQLGARQQLANFGLGATGEISDLITGRGSAESARHIGLGNVETMRQQGLSDWFGHTGAKQGFNEGNADYMRKMVGNAPQPGGMSGGGGGGIMGLIGSIGGGS